MRRPRSCCARRACTARRATSTSTRGGRWSAPSSRTRTPTTRARPRRTTWPPPAARACCARGSATIALQTLAYGEAVDHQRRALSPASGRPRARLGAGAHRARRPRCGSPRATTRQRRRRRRNATCAPFEPVRCDSFITESTFGLPIYRWRAAGRAVRRDQRLVARATPTPAAPACCSATLRQGAAHPGRASTPSIGPIVVHGAVEPLNARLPRGRRRAAADAASSTDVDDKALLKRALVVAPPSAQGSAVDAPLRRLQRRLRQRLDAAARRAPPPRRGPRLRAVSDHADWPGLQRAIAATGAERVIVTHGYEAVMVRWLQRAGPAGAALRHRVRRRRRSRPMRRPRRPSREPAA